MAQFEATVDMQAEAAQVFDFLLRPQNIMNISPPDVGLRFIDAPEIVELGSRIVFEVSSHGITQRATHEIIQWEYPNRFVEQQLEGPLGRWWHEHRFEVTSDGRVRVVDAIEFDPPGGLAGFVMTESRILSQLEKAFTHRHQRLQQLLEEAQ